MINDQFDEQLKRRKAIAYASSRRWSADSERRGLIGEWVLAIFFRARPDQRGKPSGDKGTDLWVLLDFGSGPRWYAVDAKAALNPVELLVPVSRLANGAHRETIYMFIGPSVDAWKCLRWEWGKEMARQPTSFWDNNDREVHHKKAYQLRELRELQEAYCGKWAWHEESNQRGSIMEAISVEEVREWEEALKTHLSETAAPGRAVPKGPDLQEWVRKYGGYWNIPWAEWDEANRSYQAKLRTGDPDA